MPVEYTGIWEGYNRPLGDEREFFYCARVIQPKAIHDFIIHPFDPDFFAADQAAKEYTARFNASIVDVWVVERKLLEDLRPYFEDEGYIKKPVLEEKTEVVVYDTALAV